MCASVQKQNKQSNSNDATEVNNAKTVGKNEKNGARQNGFIAWRIIFLVRVCFVLFYLLSFISFGCFHKQVVDVRNWRDAIMSVPISIIQKSTDKL